MSHRSDTRKSLTTWQKATALVPLALLSGAWTTSLTVSGTATAATPGGSANPDGMSLPDRAIEEPASVSQPGSVAPGVPAGAARSVIASSSTNGIPSAALAAYQRAAQVLGSADPSCRLSWQLVAAIGRVESDHGRYGGNRLGDDGRSRPGIYGIPLDGTDGTALIRDSDGGAYDNDQVYDRAVGPMQFIPSTWRVVGVDGDADGVRDPQDIDDAALATAVYLCSGDEDLSTTAGQQTAVYRYNHSQAYVDLVLSIMRAYLDGDYSSVPNGTAAPTVFAPAPKTAAQRTERDRSRASDDGQRSGRTVGTSDGGSTGGTSGSGGGDDGVPPSQDTPEEPKSVEDSVQDGAKKTTQAAADTLDSVAEAADFCASELAGITDDQTVVDKCAAKVVGMTKDDAAAAIPNTLAGVLDWLGMSATGGDGLL